MATIAITVVIAVQTNPQKKEQRRTMDNGYKYIEAIAILNRHINEGKTGTIEGLKAIALLLNRYNRFLRWYKEGRIVSLDDKYFS